MATDSTTAISRRRRARGRYPKTQDGATPKRQKRIPEYLEADEVNAIIRAAPSPKAKLLMLGAVAGRSACLRGPGPRSAGPVARYGHSHAQSTFGQGRQDQACAGASGAARRSEQRTCLRGHQPGQTHRGAYHDRVALGEDGGETG